MLEEGQMVGPYQLVRCLGAGTFGEVWLATHLDLGRDFALKIPTDPEYVKQLRREAVITFNVRHPNIVETHELNTWHDPPYLAMEYVDGGDLRARLERAGKLSLDETLGILGQVLAALHAAHHQGVIHRDLKPSNILLTKDGTAKVGDFGLGNVQAEVVHSLVLSGSTTTLGGKSVAGTLAYMSPEQQLGQEPVASDDLYAVGVTTCELLTGRRAAGARLDRVLARAGISGPIAKLIDRACEERDYRYATAAEMLADVRALAGGATTLAAEPTPATPDIITNSIGMQLKLIHPGAFTMGSGPDAYEVTLTKPFYLGVCPVTQDEYERLMGANRSGFKGPKRPVEQVSWRDAHAFCRKLSQKEGVEYRLPTEAEWEYACRAGSTTAYCFGDSESALGDSAWFRDNSGSATRDVAQKKPNAWGLFDMHGNVWEWCEDWYGHYPDGPQTDPTGPPSGEQRVLRGGAWISSAAYCRSAYRDFDTPDIRDDIFGLRVARSVP